jgi:hypothetical protein
MFENVPFSEDLVIIQYLKLLVQIVKLRLISKEESLTQLDRLISLLVHPNTQIRTGIATFICSLAGTGSQASKKNPEKTKIATGPLFRLEDVYCFLRVKIEPFFRDHLINEVIVSLQKPTDLLQKLRPPLSLKSMLFYIRKLSNMPSFNKDAE